MKDVLKTGQVLGRSEMKKIMAGSGSCSCSYGGCGVAMAYNSSGWFMSVSCGGNISRYSGTGPYGGTVCGGACPKRYSKIRLRLNKGRNRISFLTFF